jgi:hypothetical protein
MENKNQINNFITSEKYKTAVNLSQVDCIAFGDNFVSFGFRGTGIVMWEGDDAAVVKDHLRANSFWITEERARHDCTGETCPCNII